MAIRSSDFVGIAEGIKRHELSEKGRIESLKRSISELSSSKNYLENRISSLEAALAAAYEDTDEDGEPDWDRIAALESRIDDAEDRLSGVEWELDDSRDELSRSEAELEGVMEEKAQTLFEIQERARKTSQNISVAGGMYGAYSGVGSSLQNSMQQRFAMLSKAANILDGSVDGGASSGASSGSGSGGSRGGGFTSNDVSTSALSAFSTGNSFSGSIGGSAYSPSAFESSQIDVATPASMSGFRSSSKTINAQKSLNFKSDQDGNEYTASAFTNLGDTDSSAQSQKFTSSQTSQGANLNFTEEGKRNNKHEREPVILPPMNANSFKTMEESFKDGVYRKETLSEATVFYRYFGSVPDGAGVSTGTILSGNGWGSDAGGQYLTRYGNLSSEEAKELLALNPEWGNNAIYRAKIEVPAGTEVFIGIAKDQLSSNGIFLAGGGEQIVLNGYWTTDMNSWIKECNIVDVGELAKNYVGVDKYAQKYDTSAHHKSTFQYHKTLDEREIKYLRDNAEPHYDNGRQIADRVRDFNTYKEHHDIKTGHIEKVRVESLEAANALEQHFEKNNYGGLFSPNIDRKTIEVMALYHDTGMDGNIDASNYDAERNAFLSNDTIREKYVSDILAKKEKESKRIGQSFDRNTERQRALEKFREEGFESQFRPNHSLESAIHVLRDRKRVELLGVDVNEVALGFLLHSKSNSGLRNIASEEEMRVAITRLQNRVDSFNSSHPNEHIEFDSTFLLNGDGTFNREKLAEMRSEAIVLRIGDANGHDTNSRTSQNGKRIDFTLKEKTVKDTLPSNFDRNNYDTYFVEIQGADVRVDGEQLNNRNDPKGISRMFAVGEGNFKSLRCSLNDTGSIQQTFELCDGNAFPLSTQYCIKERLGEYKTAQPLTYTPVVKLGKNCSEEVKASYEKFAIEVEQEFNVRMEIEL